MVASANRGMIPHTEPDNRLLPAAGTAAPRGPAMRWGSVLLTLTVVAALGVWLHGEPQARAAMARAADLPARAWAATLAGLLLSHALRARRLQREWHPERPLSFATCLRVILTHAAAVSVLPMRAGEVALPWMLHRHGHVPWGDGTLSLAWMRLQDVLVVGGLGAATVAVVLGQQQRMAAPLVALAVAGPVAAAVGLAWLLERHARAARRHGARGAGRTPAWRLALTRGASRATRESWGWSLGAWGAKLATLAALLHDLAGTSTLGAWVGVIGGDGASALPLQPAAGFGSYEAGVALAVRWSVGSDWHDALGAALVVHLAFVLVAMGGAALMALMALWSRSAGTQPVQARRPGP